MYLIFAALALAAIASVLFSWVIEEGRSARGPKP